MLRVVESNRFEELAAAAAELLATTADPFAPVQVAVPNRVVGRWLQYAVALANQVAAGFETRYLEELIGEVLTGDAPGLAALDQPRLEALVASALADDALLAEPVMAEPRAYVDADGPDGRGPRRVQLAGQIADRFWEYALTRPDWLDAWERGAAADLGDDDPALADEAAWQARLWRAVVDGTAARAAAGTGGPPGRPGARWVATPRLAGRRRHDGLAPPPGPPLVVAGFGFLPRAYLDALAYLAPARDVIVLSTSPCAEYWGDVASVRRRPGRRGKPVTARAADDPPALTRWGRPGRDYLSSLAALSEGDIDDRFVDPTPAAPAAPTALDLWSFDTLVRAVPEGGGARAAAPGGAGVSVLACPSAARELEIVATAIVNRLAADPELTASHVAVLLPPGATELYLSQLPAVFGAVDLPYHVVDVPAIGHGHVAEAAALLLALPRGTFRRPELLGLMTHPAVQVRHPHVDPDDWVRWADALGIVHGADHADHAGTYLELADHFHWEQGLRRLALGAFMAAGLSGADSVARIGDRTYLPEEVSPDQQASAASFALLARSLIEDARWLRTVRRTLTGWAEVLDALVTAYLGGPGPSGATELRRVRTALAGVADLDLDGRELGFAEVAELAGRRLAQVKGDRGEPLAHGVHVARLVPHRPVPFRLVFALGLGEDQFPAADRPAALDLRRTRRPGDVGPRDRDRYGFLETALAARERLVVSYVAREPIAGEPREPSAVIHELAEMLAPYLDRDAGDPLDHLTVRHRLHRFDVPDGVDPLVASAVSTTVREHHALQVRAAVEQAAAARGAEVPGGRALRRTLAEAAALGPVARALGLGLGRDLTAPAATELVVVRLSALRRFLESAPQGWAQAVLRLDQDDDDDRLERDEEPLAVDDLARATLLRDALDRYLGGATVDDALAVTWDRLRLAGATPVGVFGDAARDQARATLATWADALEPRGGRDQAFTVFGIGRAPPGERRAGEVVLLPPIALEVDTPSGPRRVEVVGHTNKRGERAGWLVTAGRRPRTHHALRAAFDHMVVAAAGGGGERVPGVTLARDKVEQLTHEPWTEAEARAHLAVLVGDLLASGHDYLLDLDMSVSALSGKSWTVKPPSERSPGSIGYGPLPPRPGIEAPPDDEVSALARRRLAPLWQRVTKGGSR